MLIAVVLLLIDRVLKTFALEHSVGTGSLGGDVLQFQLFRNTGSVFSLPVPPSAMLFSSGALFLMFLAFLVHTYKTRPENTSALLLIVLGAASNLYDRITEGAVIDYLLFFGRSAINIADAMIVAGVIMLFTRRNKK